MRIRQISRPVALFLVAASVACAAPRRTAGPGDAAAPSGASGAAAPGEAGVPTAAPTVAAAPEAPAMPAEAAELMDRIVRNRTASLRSCYQERGLKQNPALDGWVRVSFELDASGAARNAAVVDREWTNVSADSAEVAAVESCITERVLAWRFPPELTAWAGPHRFEFEFSH